MAALFLECESHPTVACMHAEGALAAAAVPATKPQDAAQQFTQRPFSGAGLSGLQVSCRPGSGEGSQGRQQPQKRKVDGRDAGGSG